MVFDGFTEKDFQVFAIPDFAGRMAAIRKQIQPKLFALAEEISPGLKAANSLPSTALNERRGAGMSRWN